MSRRIVLVLAWACAAAGCGGSDGPILPEGRALAASPALTPAVHLFGDPVVAQLEVIVDRRLLEPNRLQASAIFAPYERVGAVRASRRDFGRFTRLRYEFTLRCLELACVRRGLAGAPVTELGGRRTFRFPPARLLYADRTGRNASLLRAVNWPPLEAVSRINTAQTAGRWFPFRASATPLPSLSYSVAPPLLAGALLLVALTLLGVTTRTGLRRWRAKRPAPIVDGEPELTPLERALALVDEARAGDEPARRTALQQLAEALEQSRSDELAERATELAWSRGSPSPEATASLVDRVREVDDASS